MPVVEIMGNTAGKLSDRLHLFGLTKSLLHLSALGYILPYSKNTNSVSFCILKSPVIPDNLTGTAAFCYNGIYIAFCPDILH